MACGVALKRPYDYDEYLIPEGAEAKRARHTQAHCSPFRAQIGTIAASLPYSGTSTALLQLRDPKERDAYDRSPFAQVGNHSQLSPGQLDSYLRAEVRYLKRRHLIPHRTFAVNSVANDDTGDSSGAAKRPTSSTNAVDPGNSYREAPSSPNANSGSDSDGEVTNAQKASQMQDIYEKPQFSLKQVRMICERLLKQQEVRLRYEYETVLNQRLEGKCFCVVQKNFNAPRSYWKLKIALLRYILLWIFIMDVAFEGLS